MSKSLEGAAEDGEDTTETGTGEEEEGEATKETGTGEEEEGETTKEAESSVEGEPSHGALDNASATRFSSPGTYTASRENSER